MFVIPRSALTQTQISRMRYVSIVLILLEAAFASPVAEAGRAGGKGGESGARPTTSVPGKQFDAQGRYRFRVDSSGRRYDAQGRYLGKIDEHGRQYDSQGRYLGRIESTSGRVFDAQGRYRSRIDIDGRQFDDKGQYLGRIDADGRQFDARGRYTGKLEAGAGKPSVGSSEGSTSPEKAAAITAVGTAALVTVPADESQNTTAPAPHRQSTAPFVFCKYGEKDCGR